VQDKRHGETRQEIDKRTGKYVKENFIKKKGSQKGWENTPVSAR
jgi:hypothetical protein